MSLIKKLFAILSIVAQLGLAGLMFLVGLFGIISGEPLKLDMLPWASGVNAGKWLFGLGAVGILACVLAALGRFRILFALWCGFVLYQVVWYMWANTSYSFGSVENMWNAGYLLAGAVVTFIASIAMLNLRKRKKDRLV